MIHARAFPFKNHITYFKKVYHVFIIFSGFLCKALLTFPCIIGGEMPVR